MSKIEPPSRILVTGANGFIGAYCVAHLLSSGFKVVGTVRTAEKAQKVLDSHSKNPFLSIKVVPDLTALYAFDEAIKGCVGVLHLAAPFGYMYKNFEEDLLIPSINGTKAICLAATREKSVKRVILTSSFAAIYDASLGPSPGRVYTEKDWSPLTYEDGKNATMTPIAYRASKVLAEKTAWEFVEKEKPQWDLVTLCPGMVFGPLWPDTISSPKELNTSNGLIWALFDAETIPETRAPVWTSVTALARAHTLALTTESASNSRFLVTNGEYDNQELADCIHESQLPSVVKARVPKGRPGDRSSKNGFYSVDNTKAKKGLNLALDLPEESLPSTVVSLVQQLLDLEGNINAA